MLIKAIGVTFYGLFKMGKALFNKDKHGFQMAQRFRLGSFY